MDFVFPRFCFGCGKEGTWLCGKCGKKIEFVPQPQCPYCKKPTENGNICNDCRQGKHKKSPLKGVWSATFLADDDRSLREMIHQFKYESTRGLGDILGKILIKGLKIYQLPQNAVIVPVPLYFRRRWQRGYNQAEILAQKLSRTTGWPIIPMLKRVKATKSQVVVQSKTARQKNLEDAFAVNRQSLRTADFSLPGGTKVPPPKSWWLKKLLLQCGLKSAVRRKMKVPDLPFILLDDVLTTGATLEECARVLKEEAGAKEVWGIVLARER